MALTRTALVTGTLVAGVLTAAVAAPAVSASSPAAGGSQRIAVGHVDRSVPSPEAGSRATAAYPGTAGRTERSVIGRDGRSRVTDTTAYPARAIGQIEFVQDAGEFICTGWLVDENTILTSGHCSFEPDGVEGNIIESATFTPGRNADVDAFGSCPVYEVMSPLAWRKDGLANNDWSMMQLGTNDGTTITTCDIGTTVGWFGITWKAGKTALTGVDATVQGYPGDKKFGTQWTMSGTIFKSTSTMVYYPMDTFGGQSGSPVFKQTATACGGPCGLAIHSYGVGGSGAGATNNSGPRITESRYTTMTSYAAENDPPPPTP